MRFQKDKKDCKHTKISRNGHFRNGQQRWICKECGCTIKNLTKAERDLFNANIDLINCYKSEIIREDYIYQVNPDEESADYPVRYKIIPEKIIKWNSFKRKLKRSVITEPILVYYMTADNARNARSLHIARVDVS